MTKVLGGHLTPRFQQSRHQHAAPPSDLVRESLSFHNAEERGGLLAGRPQRIAIETFAKREGYEVAAWHSEAESGKGRMRLGAGRSWPRR